MADWICIGCRKPKTIIRRPGSVLVGCECPPLPDLTPEGLKAVLDWWDASNDSATGSESSADLR